MKKSLSALVVLLTLGAAGAAVYLFEKAGRSGASTASVADYLPAETLLLFSVPDLNRTAAEWQTTDLHKIWTEPDVQAFLAKPLSRLPTDADFTDTITRIARLEPQHGFIALTALDEKSSQPHLVAGFQFKGPSTDVDKLLATPKDEMRKHFPGGKADLINYQGHPVETFDAGDGNVVASVYLGDQYFIANDIALLKSTIDRVEHRNPAAGQPALGKEADFEAVVAKMHPGCDTLIFARPQVFVGRLYALAAASGQAIDTNQRAEADKVRAVAASTQIENGKFRDAVYILAPGRAAPPATLQMSAQPLTSSDTVFFATGIFKLPTHFELPLGLPPGAPGADLLAEFHDLTAILEAHGLKLADLNAAFGSEPALQIDWPANSAHPKLLASLDVRDAALAGKFMDNLTQTLTTEAGWQTSQSDGLVFHTLTSPGINFFSPTLTLSSKHAMVGLNLPDVREAAAREKAGTPNFTQSEPYKAAAASVEKPNVAFAYLDSRVFFERFYGALKPFALLGTAFVYPQAGEYVDLGKLPPTEAISKHLSPTVFSETSDQQGILLESVGSFTFGEAAAVVTGGAGAAAIPILEQRGFLPHANASSVPAQPGINQ